MTLKNMAYSTLSFVLTLLLTGFLHSHVYVDNYPSLDQSTSQQLSKYSLHNELAKTLPRTSNLNVQKYQLKSQPTPEGDVPPFYAVRHLISQYNAAIAQSPIPTPWFITHAPPNTDRISGWKDNNLLYKNQAIQHT